MFTRFADWLDRQPPRRRQLYGAFIALTLLTLPCYAGGLLLRAMNVAPPPRGERVPTAEPGAPTGTPTASPSPGPSPTFRLIPSVVPMASWTPAPFVPQPTGDGSPSPEVTPDPNATATDSGVAPTPGPSATAPEPSAEPSATPEPPTAAPTAAPTDTGPAPTAIGGFTPEPPPAP